MYHHFIMDCLWNDFFRNLKGWVRLFFLKWCHENLSLNKDQTTQLKPNFSSNSLKLPTLWPKSSINSFEFINTNSTIKGEIYSQLTIEAPDVVLMSSLLTLNTLVNSRSNIFLHVCL